MTPCKRHVLQNHRLEMVLDGHENMVRDVTLEAGQFVVEFGSTRPFLSSSPAGAMVVIDGEEVGLTPLRPAESTRVTACKSGALL